MRVCWADPSVEGHLLPSICISHRNVAGKWCQVQTPRWNVTKHRDIALVVALIRWSDITQCDKQEADMTAKVAQCVSGCSPVLTSKKVKSLHTVSLQHWPLGLPSQTIFCTRLQGKLGVPGLPGYPGRQGPKVIKNCLTFIWIFESFKSAADERHSLWFFWQSDYRQRACCWTRLEGNEKCIRGLHC